jgi:hypothetical protein
MPFFFRCDIDTYWAYETRKLEGITAYIVFLGGCWQAGIVPEIKVQHLYEQADFSEKVWIERWLPNTQLVNVVETEIKEILCH